MGVDGLVLDGLGIPLTEDGNGKGCLLGDGGRLPHGAGTDRVLLCRVADDDLSRVRGLDEAG